MHATWQTAGTKTGSGALGTEPESVVAGRAIDSCPDAVHDRSWFAHFPSQTDRIYVSLDYILCPMIVGLCTFLSDC